MRPRKTNRHLPANMYLKHGAYYLVHKNKWTMLGKDYPSALQQYARMVRGTDGDMKHLIDNAIATAREKKLAENTIKQYEIAATRLKTAFSDFRVDEVTPADVGKLMEHHSATPNFANRMRSLLRMAFKPAVRTGVCAANPTDTIEPFKERKRDRYITDEEWSAICAHASPALRCMMDIAYLTAQRIGDVLAIRLDQVSDEGITFRQEKTKKRLMVATSPELADAIKRAKGLHRARTLYLLGQSNGKPRSYRGARDLLVRAATRVGVDDVGWHDIRAKSITDAKKQGLDAQQLAGHSTEQQTNRYLRSRETTVVTGPSFRQTGKY